MFCVCTAFLSKSYEIPVRARAHTYKYTQYMHSFFHTYTHTLFLLSILLFLVIFPFIFPLVSHVFYDKIHRMYFVSIIFREIKGSCTFATRSSRLNAIFILVLFNFLLIILLRLAMFFSLFTSV